MMDRLNCDLCGKIIKDYDNDLWHYQGKLRGVFNPHIHVCKTCKEKYALKDIDFDAILSRRDMFY